MPKYSPERIKEIRAHLVEIEDQGISVADFAHEHGVSPCTVYYWRKRFGDGHRHVQPSRAPTNDRTEFIEVERPAFGSQLEIILDEVTIRVPASFDASALERVLEVLKTC